MLFSHRYAQLWTTPPTVHHVLIQLLPFRIHVNVIIWMKLLVQPFISYFFRLNLGLTLIRSSFIIKSCPLFVQVCTTLIHSTILKALNMKRKYEYIEGFCDMLKYANGIFALCWFLGTISGSLLKKIWMFTIEFSLTCIAT